MIVVEVMVHLVLKVLREYRVIRVCRESKGWLVQLG
jgi:hypothetical protein